MNTRAATRISVGLGVVLSLGIASAGREAAAVTPTPGVLQSLDGSGILQTISLNGDIDRDNPFFQDLGTNGRTCVTCHQPGEAWSFTPEGARERFARSRGTDPLFTNNDGANCEGATPRTIAERRAAYSLALSRGLIRIGLDVPAGAEFVIERVDDPNHCGPSTNDVSVYRRPLPSTNLTFISAVMWDGRESSASTTIREDLLHQANSATRGHAAAAADLTAEQANAIVDFELGLFTAQQFDTRAGRLDSRGALGGATTLAQQPFFIGINDPVLMNPTNAPFDPAVFTLFGAWQGELRGARNEQRESVARGEQIFNTRPITLSGVSGLNGQMFPSGVTPPASLQGTCTVCHDTPNAGNHSVKAPLDIGLTDPAVAPYLPVFTLRNTTTLEVRKTTDPGRALITGRWQDVGRFKGPVLRALAARAPYFHNGAARTLEEAVDFYDRRFTMNLTRREKADLVAFLRSL